jgi:hypothetical protein
MVLKKDMVQMGSRSAPGLKGRGAVEERKREKGLSQPFGV